MSVPLKPPRVTTISAWVASPVTVISARSRLTSSFMAPITASIAFSFPLDQAVALAATRCPAKTTAVPRGWKRG